VTTVSAERVLKVRDVARHLDCDEATVYGLIRAGRLRVIKLGRVFRVPESAVQQFIAGNV
jgi:excisionase family DNA binding protein